MVRPPTKNLLLPSGRVTTYFKPGKMPVVLLIHGNSSCKEIFLHQLSALSKHGFGILAPDLPGHGASQNARNPRRIYSFPGYAAVISALLDNLDLSTVHVLGWSLGGHIGLEMLATDGRVRSLMIIGTPPIDPGPAALKDAFIASPAMSLAGKRNFTVPEARAYAESMLGGPRHLTVPLLRAARRTDGSARYWMVKNGLAGQGVDEIKLVGSKTTPLAVVRGDRDAFVSFSYIQGLRYRALWHKRVQVVSRAGHAPHWQRPRLFNRLLLAFLRSVA
jgi:pimeloyl-ACP methyl ester carboxylesterase